MYPCVYPSVIKLEFRYTGNAHEETIQHIKSAKSASSLSTAAPVAEPGSLGPVPKQNTASCFAWRLQQPRVEVSEASSGCRGDGRRQ